MKRLLTHHTAPLLISTLALHPVSAALAKDTTPQQLPTTEVVASPIIEENQLDAFSDVSSLITEEQLRDQNAMDLTSAMRRTPGVQVTRFNPVGNFGGDSGGGVFIRGMGQSRPGSEIQTYVDGIPFSMGVWNHPLLDMLPVNGMQAITVHKSPQPYLNGDNFASINLDTKRASQDGVHGNGRVSGGIYGTFNEQVDVNGKQGPWDYMLAQGYTRSDGHRDNADGDLKNVMGRAGYQFNPNWSLGVNFLYVDTQAGDPGDSRYPKPAQGPRYNTNAGLVGLTLSHHHHNWQGDFKLYHNAGTGSWLNYNDYNNGGISTNGLYDFDTSGIRWKETLTPWQGGELVAGVDNDWNSGSVNDVNSARSVNTALPTFSLTQPFVALNQTIALSKDWSLVPSAGVRYYDHSHFESASSPHAGLSLVSDRATVFVNFSRGIHYPGLEAPSLNAFMPVLGMFGDKWQKLNPEEVEHGEVGVKLKPFETTQLDLSVFNDRIRNRYIFQFMDGSGFNPAFLNIGEYAMRGFEGALKQQLSPNWSLFAGLTLLNPSIEHLPYTPARSVTAGINGQIQKIKLSVDAQYQSQTTTLNRSRGPEPNLDTVSAFVVVNARAGYPLPLLGKAGEVFINAENLLDREYSYRQGYPMPGIWGQVGIAASF
jgi:outer membrane cobalamin receptor